MIKKYIKLEILESDGPMHPAELVKSWIGANRITLAELADKCDMIPSNLSPYMTKKRKWNMVLIDRIEKATGIDAEELLILNNRWLKHQKAPK